MAVITIEFAVTGDPRQASEVIQERLELLPLVDTAEVHTDETRQGFADGVSILLGTVVVLKLTTAAIAQLRLLMREIAGLQRDLTGTQSILVHFDGTKLDPANVDETQLAKLVAGLHAAGA